MANKPDADQYSEQEAKRRMDDALRRALNTPHKPHSDLTGKKAKSPKADKAKSSPNRGR